MDNEGETDETVDTDVTIVSPYPNSHFHAGRI